MILDSGGKVQKTLRKKEPIRIFWDYDEKWIAETPKRLIPTSESVLHILALVRDVNLHSTASEDEPNFTFGNTSTILVLDRGMIPIN